MSNRDGVSMIMPSGRGDCLSRGNADRFLIGYLMPSVAGGPLMMKNLVRVYREHYPVIKLYPDAEQVLRFLPSRCRLAVVSDGPAVSQRRKVEALSLKSYFDPIILTAEWGAKYAKPSHLAFREVETKRGVSGDVCAYIADNPLKDFLGPRVCGWQTVRVRRLDGIYGMLEPEPGYEADLEASDLREAVSKLNLG